MSPKAQSSVTLNLNLARAEVERASELLSGAAGAMRKAMVRLDTQKFSSSMTFFDMLEVPTRSCGRRCDLINIWISVRRVVIMEAMKRL